MEKAQSPEIAKIKSIHGELFDLSVQLVLYDQIRNELEKNTAQTKCEISMMQQLETELIARNKDLDKILERGLSDYQTTLTTRLEQEFSQIYLEGPEGQEEADEEMVLAHMRQLESGTTALEAGLHNNQTMKEMRIADQDLERFESERQKLDEALSKLDREKGQESYAVEERRNKVIVDLVQTWKERQLIQIQKSTIESTPQQLLNPTQNQEVQNNVKETRGNRTTKISPKLTKGGIPAFDMIFNHTIDPPGKLILVSPPKSHTKDPPRKPLTRNTTFCTKSFDDQLTTANQKHIESSAQTKVVAQVTKPAKNKSPALQVDTAIKRKVQSPIEITGKPIENVPSTTDFPPPAVAPSPAKKTRQSPRHSVPPTHHSPPSEKRKCPPKKKPSPPSKKNKVADNSPPVEIQVNVNAAAAKAPAKSPSHKSAAANQSPPGMDQEFESFCDVASLGVNSKSLAGEGEDANESFFGGEGGGFAAPSNDGDGDNNNSNWF